MPFAILPFALVNVSSLAMSISSVFIGSIAALLNQFDFSLMLQTHIALLISNLLTTEIRHGTSTQNDYIQPEFCIDFIGSHFYGTFGNAVILQCLFIHFCMYSNIFPDLQNLHTILQPREYLLKISTHYFPGMKSNYSQWSCQRLYSDIKVSNTLTIFMSYTNDFSSLSFPYSITSLLLIICFHALWVYYIFLAAFDRVPSWSSPV